MGISIGRTWGCVCNEKNIPYPTLAKRGDSTPISEVLRVGDPPSRFLAMSGKVRSHRLYRTVPIPDTTIAWDVI